MKYRSMILKILVGLGIAGLAACIVDYALGSGFIFSYVLPSKLNEVPFAALMNRQLKKNNVEKINEDVTVSVMTDRTKDASNRVYSVRLDGGKVVGAVCDVRNLLALSDAYLFFSQMHSGWSPEDKIFNQLNCRVQSDERVFGVNQLVDTACPGQYVNRAEKELQSYLYRPLIDLTAGSEDEGILKKPEMPGGRIRVCKGAKDVNCLLTAEHGTFYCGRINRERRPASDLEEAGPGYEELRALPEDIAMSAYYLMMHAAQEPSSPVIPVECGRAGASVLHYAALAQEVITPSSAKNFSQTYTNELDPAEAKSLRTQVWNKLQGYDDRVCVLLSSISLQYETENRRETVLEGDVTATDQREIVEEVLSMPVVKYRDGKEPSKVSPIFSIFREAARDKRVWEERFADVFKSAEEIRDNRESPREQRIYQQVQDDVGGLEEAKVRGKADIALRIGYTGKYDLTNWKTDSYQVAERGRPYSYRSTKFYKRILPGQIEEMIESCEKDRAKCTFTNIWKKSLLPESVRNNVVSDNLSEFLCFVGLFGKKGTDDNCARALMSALVDASKAASRDSSFADFMQALAGQALGGGGVFKWQKTNREYGLLPREVFQIDGPEIVSAPAQECELVLGVSDMEPFEHAAEKIAELVKDKGIDVSVATFSQKTIQEPLAAKNWDVLMTTTGPYTSRQVPTLMELVYKSRATLSAGTPLRDAEDGGGGMCVWYNFESKIVRPVPIWAKRSLKEDCTKDILRDLPENRLEALLLLEKEVFEGPAPILPLYYSNGFSYTMGDDD